MTETLSAEDKDRIKTLIMNNTRAGHLRNENKTDFPLSIPAEPELLQKALNTIEAKDQEIEALKGQVAAQESILDLFQDVLNEKTISEESIKNNWDLGETETIDWVDLWSFVKAFENRNTQATAEAFIDRIRDDQRVETILGLSQKIIDYGEAWKARYRQNKENGPYSSHFENGYMEAIADLQLDIEALLTKEQA